MRCRTIGPPKEKPFQAVVPIGRDGKPVPTFEDEGDPGQGVTWRSWSPELRMRSSHRTATLSIQQSPRSEESSGTVSSGSCAHEWGR